jgi:hypothetical protein
LVSSDGIKYRAEGKFPISFFRLQATRQRNKCPARALSGIRRKRAIRQARQSVSELQTVNMESSDLSQPGMAERAIDTATDVSRTITEASAALRVAVDGLSNAIATARQQGKPLATIAAITREAPLASLFVAFLFGVAVARRR